MAEPIVDSAYLKEIERARRDLRALIFNANCAPVMLRLALHDSRTYDVNTMTGGPSDSIRNVEEFNHGSDNGLKIALDLCEQVKSKCPKITYADLYQLAGVIAVEVTGGPTINFVPGRKEQIIDQVANMWPWPKTLEVEILDQSRAIKKPVGILHVKVVHGMKLKKKHLLGASDPYVKLKLTETKAPSKKTAVKHKNLNPEWNEEFSMVVNNPETQALELTVYDWKQFGIHEEMGMNVIPLKELPPDELIVMTVELLKNLDLKDTQNDKMRGQIVIELVYKPFTEEDVTSNVESADGIQKAPEGTPPGRGLLVVVVHEAQDLEGKHHTNPFVCILFKGEKRKTKQIKKNRDPRWGEDFTFMLDEPPLKDKVHVEVQSTSSRIGLLHPKETLGYVDIDLADVISTKRINETFYLIDSKNGSIRIELQWRTS